MACYLRIAFKHHFEGIGSTCESTIDRYFAELDCVQNKEKYLEEQQNQDSSDDLGAGSGDEDVDMDLEDDDVDNFNLFNDNTPFSLFGSAHNSGATKDEWLENIAFYMPNCRIPEIATGDEDGILTDNITGQAYKDQGNDTIFIAFI